jgi:hypothetical protein
MNSRDTYNTRSTQYYRGCTQETHTTEEAHNITGDEFKRHIKQTKSRTNIKDEQHEPHKN